MVGDSNDETNVLHKQLLSDTQVSRICKAFANGSLAIIKLLKTQLPKMVQLGGFFNHFLNFAFDPFKLMSECIKKVQNLVKKVLDNESDLAVD